MTSRQITQQLAFDFGTAALEAPGKAQVRLLAILPLPTSFARGKRPDSKEQPTVK